MNLRRYFLIIFFLIFTTLCFSLELKKDNVTTDKTTSTITTSISPMYGKTESKKAEEFFKKAFDFELKSDFKNAEKFYIKAIEEDKRFVEAYDNLGKVYRNMKMYDDAIKNYKISINLYPAGLVGRLNLASVYAITKSYDKAIVEYKEISRIFPKSPEGYFGLANSYMMTRKFKNALENAQKALEIYKKTNSHYIGDGYQMIGLINYYSNNRNEAKKYLKLAKKNGAIIPLKIEYDLFKDELDYKRMFQLKTEKDYKETEKYVINATNWLINEDTGQKTDKNKLISTFLIKWAEGSPYVSIPISQKVVTYSQNPDYLLVFIAGSLKYSIENKDYKSKYKASIAGTKSVIKYYLRNKKNLGSDEGIEKFIKLEKSGKLDEYIQKVSK